METPGPWWRDVTADQWKAFFAAYLGWVLDAFDFTILTFLLVDIQRSFTVNNALAGALGTVTLMFRMIGGIASGTLADRWGRKVPLMASILWYSAFAFLGGFSRTYTVLFICRALFGIGMGGTWAAGMPLALETWPARLRGKVSGMLQSGYSTGFMLSAFAFAFIYPAVNHGDNGWRTMLWIGVLPSLLVAWIIGSVKESPVWLERQRHLRETGTSDTLSIKRLFAPDLLPVTIQTSLMMGAFLVFYYSITFWYATLVASRGHSTLPFLVALNFGTMMGNLTWGQLSETSVGRRGAATIATVGGVGTDSDLSFHDGCHADVARCIPDGHLRGGQLRRDSDVPERALPHRGAGRRCWLLLSRGRVPRIVHHVLHRPPPRRRPAAQ